MVAFRGTSSPGIEVERARREAEQAQLLADLQAAQLVPGRDVLATVLAGLGPEIATAIQAPRDQQNRTIIQTAKAVAAARNDELNIGWVRPFTDKNARLATDYLKGVLEHRAGIVQSLAKVPTEPASTHFRDMVSMGTGKGREL